MLITSIYTLTIFTSAFLLFLIQPMISKLLLPHLGGSPAVWNTAMLFFQIMLLLGYAYAHLGSRYLGPKRQSILHMVMLCLAAIWLPITAKTNLGFVSAVQPIQWVMLSLFLSVGGPFFVLSANAPLLQSWLAHTDHPDAKNPYFLYSASNIGSLIALFGYPLLMEPLFTLSQQTYLWSSWFVLFGALILGCIVYLRKHYVPLPAVTEEQGTKPRLTQKLHWIFLSFCPSSLLLGVTTYITTDLASIPLFWVIPLAIYLLTFIFAFARKPILVDRMLSAQVILVPLTAIAMLFDLNSVTAILLLHLMTFFAFVMGCHGTLARLKPDPRYLTEYFLWISFGGMLGGLFNALIAPQIFDEPFEYPLIFIMTLLLRPQLIADVKRERILDYVVPVAFVALKSHKRPLRYALFVLALFVAVPIGKNIGTSAKDEGGTLLFAERNFFGVNRLFKFPPTNSMVLLHGTTLHGIQSMDPDHKLDLTSYYSVIKPVYDHVGKELQHLPVAVLGLGAGTLACIGHEEQKFDFFEIDPAIALIASNPSYFTFLTNCPPTSTIRLGDGRLEIAKMDAKHYGFIVVDTFSSDSIPVHILTKEAIAIYLRKLADGGMIAFNISNRHLDLAPLMSAMIKDAGFVALIKADKVTDDKSLISSSIWVVAAKKIDDFHGLEKDDPHWQLMEDAPRVAIWTDNYSNIFQTLF